MKLLANLLIALCFLAFVFVSIYTGLATPAEALVLGGMLALILLALLRRWKRK